MSPIVLDPETGRERHPLAGTGGPVGTVAVLALLGILLFVLYAVGQAGMAAVLVALVVAAFYWFGPLVGWLEIDGEGISGAMGRHRWEEAALGDLVAAYMVQDPRAVHREAFKGVMLLLRSGAGERLRLRRLLLADEEAFLVDLASQTGFHEVEGGVARR